MINTAYLLSENADEAEFQGLLNSNQRLTVDFT